MTEEPTRYILINGDFGGLRASDEAMQWMRERGLEFNRDNLAHRVHQVALDCYDALGEEFDDMLSVTEKVTFQGDLFRLVQSDGWEWIETPSLLKWRSWNELRARGDEPSDDCEFQPFAPPG
mgnify:CR=1 FL=1